MATTPAQLTQILKAQIMTAPGSGDPPAGVYIATAPSGFSGTWPTAAEGTSGAAFDASNADLVAWANGPSGQNLPHPPVMASDINNKMLSYWAEYRLLSSGVKSDMAAAAAQGVAFAVADSATLAALQAIVPSQDSCPNIYTYLQSLGPVEASRAQYWCTDLSVVVTADNWLNARNADWVSS